MNNPGVPGANLPASEDHVVRAIADIWRFVRELGPSVARSFAPVIADLTAKQVTLDAQQATLTAQQATLTTQQATLTANVADIAANVASINSLIGQQVVATAGNATTGYPNVALTTSAASYAVITVGVPVGFTRAAVSANSAAYIGTDTGSMVQMRTRIGGFDGPLMDVPGPFGNGASNYALVLTVASGGSFTVATRANVTPGTGNALLTTAASVTFYR